MTLGKNPGQLEWDGKLDRNINSFTHKKRQTLGFVPVETTTLASLVKKGPHGEAHSGLSSPAELLFFQLNSHTVVSEGHYPSRTPHLPPFTVADLKSTCSTYSIDTI